MGSDAEIEKVSTESPTNEASIDVSAATRAAEYKPQTAQVDIVERALCVLAAIGLLILAQVNFGVEVSAAWRAQISPLGFALALGLAVAACSVRSPRALRIVSIAVLVSAAVLTGFEAAAALLPQPGYLTDDGAFVQYATHLLLNGKNPYTHSLAPGLLAYGLPPVPTALTNGSVSTAYVYPSLPVLLNVPFYWFSNGVQSVNIAAVFFQIVSAVMLFVMLPRQFRALAVVVIFELPLLFGFEIAGSFYPMLLPFALIAIWRWTEIGRGGHLTGFDFVRAVALGLACAVEQIAWLIALFLVVGLWRARREDLGPRRSGVLATRYAAIAIGTFAIVNMPFIVLGPYQWAKDVVAPFTQSSIPYGEGLIDLTLFLRAGGGNLSYFSYAALLLLLGTLVAYVVWFQALWRAAIVLAGVMFFVSTRPLDGYWLELAPLWLASVLIVREPLGKRTKSELFAWRRGSRTVFGFAVFMPALAFIALALTASPPLRLRIENATVEENLGDIWQVTARVTNLTDHRVVEPHFALNSGGQLSAYWNVESGPRWLPAHASATYELSSPNLATNPLLSTPFVISAILANPGSVSTSPVFQTVHLAVWLNPSQVNHLVPVGRTVVMSAQLENSSTGSATDKKGVPIALTQLVLGERGAVRGPAIINGQRQPKGLAIAYTNDRGIATFRVRDTNLSGRFNHPIWFRAFVYSFRSYTYGSLNAVEVRWFSSMPARRH